MSNIEILNRLKIFQETKRLSDGKKGKDDSMLWRLANCTGKEDVFLIKQEKDFSNYKEKWDRLPVDIDLTIENKFKKIVKEPAFEKNNERRIRVNPEFIQQIIEQNVLEADQEAQERYNTAINNAQRRAEERIIEYAEYNTFNDTDDDYYEYIQYAYESEMYKSFTLSLRQHKIVYDNEGININKRGFSRVQVDYISDEINKENNKFWKRFYKKKEYSNIKKCPDCGCRLGPIPHFCDAYDNVHPRLKKFPIYSLYKFKSFGLPKNEIKYAEILKIPEKKYISKRKLSVLALNKRNTDDYDTEDYINILE